MTKQSPLPANQKLAIQPSQFNTSPLKYLKLLNKLPVKSVLQLLGVYFLILCAALIIKMIASKSTEADIGGTLALNILIVYLLARLMLNLLYRPVAINRFARRNGMLFSQITKAVNVPSAIRTRPGVINIDLFSAPSNVTRSLVGPTPVDFYEYSSSTIAYLGNLKIERFGVATFKTAGSHPHLLLDSRANGLNKSFRNSQQVELEGNFNKYFSLYVPSGAHIDALSILSPDVMQSLIDTSADFDIEIEGNNINVICPGGIYTTENWPKVIKCIEAIVREVGHKDKTWRASAAEIAKFAPLKRRWLTIGLALSATWLLWILYLVARN